MNGSFVTANTAGIESTAKTRSVASDRDQHRAAAAWRYRLPASSTQNSAPWYSGTDGTNLLEEPEDRDCFCGVISACAGTSILTPVKIRMRAEDVDDPVERLEQRRAGDDEDRAHDERAEDPPEQHAVLVGLRHREVREDHEEDEDVVDRQRLLDQVAGRGTPGLASGRTSVQTAEVEREGECRPTRRSTSAPP